MPRISMQSRLADLAHQRELTIFLRRLFRKELRKLRNLPTPDLSITEYYDTYLNLSYHATFANMRDSEKYLRRFAAAVGLENIESKDESSGVRVFTGKIASTVKTEKDRDIYLFLRLCATPAGLEDNPDAKCRKVLIGTDSHTYTAVTPKYKIVCDEE